MLTSLLLTLTVGQLPATEPAVEPAPPAAAKRPLTPAEQRQADLRRLVEQRRQRRVSGMARKTQALTQMRAQAVQQQAQAAQQQAQAAQQQALRNLTAAEQRRAAVAEAQYRLNSQAAGAPQVFVPGEGMVPYANGIAPPWWWGLRQALSGSTTPPGPAPGPNTNPATTLPAPASPAPLPILNP